MRLKSAVRKRSRTQDLDKNIIRHYMTLTSYCRKSPIKEALDESFAQMSVDELVEIEEAMQRWQVDSVEQCHVYEDDGMRFAVLVRRVPHSRRKLVAVHDRNNDWIEAVNLEPGVVGKVVQPAHLWLGPYSTTLLPNPGWTG